LSITRPINGGYLRRTFKPSRTFKPKRTANEDLRVGRQEVDVAVTDIAPWPAFSFGDGDRARRYFSIGSTVHEQVTHPW
jgi:hypothetical protein